MERKPAPALLLALALLLLASAAGATSISYQAVDLADTAGGGDLWEYRYTVEGADFAADAGFTVVFELGLYESLEADSFGDWDVLVAQPDPEIPDGGFYDAMAKADGASLASPFTVRFVWLGAGAGPGAQSFQVYGYDQAGGFATLESGVTQAAGAAVPEPATLALLGSGLLALGGRRLRRKTS